MSARRVVHDVLVGFQRGSIERVGEALDAAELVGRDRGFARELAFGVVRRRRLLDAVFAPLMRDGLPEDPRLLTVLRLGVYQLAFMRVATHAAVGETVQLAIPRKRGVANAVLRRVAREILLPRAADPAAPREEVDVAPDRCLRLTEPLPESLAERMAVVFSLPTFLVAGWVDRFGAADALRCAEASVASPPPLHVRATERADSVAALIERLAAEGVRAEATDEPTLLRVEQGAGATSPVATEVFRAGWLVVQDPTAFAAARSVGAQPGERILDLCAAPGTKTAFLAEQVGSAGHVFAYDADPTRRARILPGLTRLGLADRVTVVHDLGSIAERFDRVLVDAPCSNSGVLARRVEVRDRLAPEAIERLANQQLEILRAATAYVRPGGTLIYSTCSIERAENEDVAAAFLAAHPTFTAGATTFTRPEPGHHDGGFTCAFCSA